MASFLVDDGSGALRPIRLSGAIAQGAVGTIHRVIGEPGIVAKLYKDPNDLPEYREKIEAMLSAPPQLPAFRHDGRTYVQIAWPRASIIDRFGFRGFVMPEVDFQNSTELENVLQKSVRQRKQLPEFYGTRVLLAANLAALMAELHALGHYMVDMKPMNMRFYPQAWYMAILDTDGFSINGKRRLPARQFSDEYIAPDAKGKKPEQLGLEQDLFALAVIIFRLLNNGIHPYQGIDVGNYPTTLQERIFAGLYAYGIAGHRGVKPARPSVHEYLEDATRALFDAAFQAKGSRPMAEEWRDHLNGLINNKVLVRCSTDPKNHGHFSKGCGFCAVEQRLAGARAVVPRAPTSALRTVQSSGRVLNTLQTAMSGRLATRPTFSSLSQKLAWPFMAIGAIILAVYTFKQSQQQTPTADTIEGGPPAAVTTNVTTAPRPVQTTRLAPDTSVKQLPSVGSTPLQASELSQNEIDAFRAKLMGCWTPPPGVAHSKNVIVIVKFALNRDGLISGEPVVVNRSTDALFQIAAESATRAVRLCQPFHLPASKYEAWLDVEVKFDPNDIMSPPPKAAPSVLDPPQAATADGGALPAAVASLPAVLALRRNDPASFERFMKRFATSAANAPEDELLSIARAALRKSVKRLLANSSSDTLLEITEAYLAYMQGLRSTSAESCVALSDESKGAKLTSNLAKQFPIQFIRDMSVLERVANTNPSATVTPPTAEQARPYLETVFNNLRQQPVKSELLGRDKLNQSEFTPYCSLIIAFYQAVLKLPRDDKIKLLRYLYASAATDPDSDLEKEPNTAKRTMTIPTPPSDARSTQGATVSQKVVLYEEDQANPPGKQYVGSVMWRTDRVPPGPGQKPEVAVRADIEIPEQNTAIRWSLRRNDDKSLPASHTVEIRFKLPAELPHGGISNIPGVLMKQGETARGVPLNGVAVKLTANFFVIGLSSVDADMQRNIQLLKERSWFDIPVVYGDGKRAIIAIEKGTPGERAFADAFDAWGTAISETKPPLTSPPPANPPPVARLELSPSSPTSSAPTSRGTLVPLHFEGGTFTVPVSINNKLTLDFVLDSGAADVSIPADVVLTLIRTGTLSAADFLGKQTYRLADGSTVPSQTFRIKSLKVGDKEIENVTGSVAPVEGSLLLGQSFLSHFKSWSIDNNRRVLILE